MKLETVQDFKKAWSTYYLVALSILAIVETFVQSLVPFIGPYGAPALAVVAVIGAVLRALPQPNKKNKDNKKVK